MHAAPIAMALLVIAAAVFWLHARFAIQTESLALRVGVTFLLAFLILLVVRYVVLLWLSYLQHIGTSAALRAPEDRGNSVDASVSILVPAFNEGPVIESAIASLLELDWPSFEIIVIDDGSTDDTYERAVALEGRHGAVTVRVLRKANAGKASALNTGLSVASSPFVLCMDADSRLERGTLRRAMRHFAECPLGSARVGAVAGNVKVINRDTLWTRLQALEYIQGLNLPRRAQGFLRVVNIVPGPIGVFRREVLTRVGGYDTDTFAEDADLTIKILGAGWQIVYEDGAVAWTEAPESVHDLLKQRYRWTRGILQALRKRGEWLASPRGDPAVWISLQALLFEAIVWPVVNVVGNLLFAVAALSLGAASMVLHWWLLLTMLDLAAALHTVAMEEEDITLVPLAIPYRFFFITLIDVAKMFATVEEFARVRMTWGKLDRRGAKSALSALHP
jgi:cellulose synthase/poly-beta-1,6-N-acetylglucosamine synthase-like glycosyltransferase